jgi:hypothetical protein
MKTIRLVALSLLVFFSAAAPAFAFAVEQAASQNNDGLPKFADPDEQKPAFVIGPNNPSSGNVALSFSGSSESAPHQGEHDDGARAFDQAFSHQQDKE